MRKVLSWVLLGVCGVRMFIPLAVAQATRLPHAHIIIGYVTPDELALHAQVGHSDALAVMPTISSGIILSIPFGDWQGFLTDFFVAALVTFTAFASVLLARALRMNSPAPRSRHPRVPTPPPRAFPVSSVC